MYKGLFILCLFFCLPVCLLAQSVSSDSNRIINPEISYIGEIMNNLTGGIKTGTGYLGMANIQISFSTKAAHMWKGGEFFVNIANTHGDEPSAKYLGDLQMASNIEAGDHVYLQEIWYRQSWKSGEITAGLMDLNIDFVSTSSGGLYLNSSFGVLPTVSGNIPAPIFPLTSLGISVKWKPIEKYTLLSAWFDGGATNFSENPHNLNWDMGAGEGILLFNEIQRETAFGILPGTYKLGLYLHAHILPEEDDNDEDIDSAYKNNNGLYLIGDQVIWQSQNKERSLSTFVQMGLSPRKHNMNHYFLGGGVNFTGLFSKHGKDIAGIAIAHDGLRGDAGNETALEFTYQYSGIDFLYVQPDMQYIINPAGVGERLKNCLVVFLRVGICL
jgi:porin